LGLKENSNMLRYPVKLTRDDNGTILVTAPDLPEVSTFGEDANDALVRTADAIATALQGRITARVKIPAPSVPRRGQPLVALAAIIAAKLELYRAMIETNTRKADLARKLGVHAPQVDRLLDLDHKSQLDQIEAAARAIGREFHIELRPAA
jgi:antitoxin HicB